MPSKQANRQLGITHTSVRFFFVKKQMHLAFAYPYHVLIDCEANRAKFIKAENETLYLHMLKEGVLGVAWEDAEPDEANEIPPRENNYHCSKKDCDYRTTSHSAKMADQQLVKDGGYDMNKTTCCPKCKEDSLVFLPV